jgi:hypothetical protein
MKPGTFMFNPFNGKPRHPSDIKSDPTGVMIVDHDEPLLSSHRELTNHIAALILKNTNGKAR